MTPWRSSRWLTADLAAGAMVAGAVSLAVCLSPAGARQPEADGLGEVARLLGLEAPARSAPPRGLSRWAAPGAAAGAGAPADGGHWEALGEGDALPQRVVLLIHGLDEPGDIFDTLAPRLVEAGHTPVYFEYPNDQGARDSADELAGSLRTLSARGAERVDIVAHWMGGLLARDVLTRPDLYAGDGRAEGLPAVGRLIMLGTPNAGSPSARLRALSELREQAMRLADDPRSGRLLAFLEDGLGEAGRDLLPGSDYLTELNSRPLPSVPLTLVVGQVAPGAPAAAGDAADELARAAARGLALLLGPDPRAADAADRVTETAAELRRAMEIIGAAVGDGVVPAESALLAGVQDVVHVEANHRGMIHTVRIEQAARAAVGLPRIDEPPAIPVVLDRLGNDE